jgi:hypothetical protein
MHLDMQTMSAVNVTVTAILGGVLLFCAKALLSAGGGLRFFS